VLENLSGLPIDQQILDAPGFILGEVQALPDDARDETPISLLGSKRQLFWSWRCVFFQRYSDLEIGPETSEDVHSLERREAVLVPEEGVRIRHFVENVLHARAILAEHEIRDRSD